MIDGNSKNNGRGIAAIHRRFGLLDAMILVVASGGCFGWLRSMSNRELGWTFYTHGLGLSQTFNLLSTARLWFEIFVAILVSLTLASLLMRLRRPRAAFYLLMRQPGLIATLAATISIVLTFAMHAITSLIHSAFEPRVTSPISPFERLSQSLLLGSMSEVAGLVILTSWLILWLGRRGRFERSWIDRLGRLVGLVWLVVMLFEVAFDILTPLSFRGLL